MRIHLKIILMPIVALSLAYSSAWAANCLAKKKGGPVPASQIKNLKKFSSLLGKAGVSCKDSDGGNNPRVFGNTSQGKVSYIDQVAPGGGERLLLEFYCKPGKSGQVMAQRWECTCGIASVGQNQEGICSNKQLPVNHVQHGGMPIKKFKAPGIPAN